MNSEMRTLLESEGWIFDGSCTCNGVYTEKFKLPAKPEYLIKLQPRRGKFIGLKNSRANKFETGTNLKPYIDSL